MKDCCGDPDSVGGSLVGTIEVPGGSKDRVADAKNDGGLPTLEEVSIFAHNNAGAGDEELQNGTSDSSPFCDSSFNLDVGSNRGVFINETKEGVEDCDSFVAVEKETENLEYNRNRVPPLVEAMKEVEKGCNKSVLAEEETGRLHFAVDREPFVKTPDMAEVEATTSEGAGEGIRESLGVTCSICDGHETCSSAEQGNKSVDMCERFVGAIRKNQYNCLEDNLLIKGPQTVDHEYNNKIRDLSPLIKSGVVSETPGTHIATNLGDPGLFSEDKGHKSYNTCESVPLISSGLTAYCHSISIDENTAKQLESCSSLSEKSMGCMNTLVGEKVKHELLSDVEGIEYDLYKSKMPLSSTNNRGKDETVDLENCQGIFSSCMRSQGHEVCDHSEENSVSSEQAVDKAGFIDRRPSGGSLEEVASCFSGEGSSFQQSSFSSTAILDHPLEPLLAMDCKRKVTRDVITQSTCCSDVKVSDGRKAANSKSIPLIVFRRSNPKRAASMRTNQPDVKPDCITRKKNRLRKLKKSADSGASFSNITNRITIARKKRSYSNRLARKSVWGETDSLVTFFIENNSSSDLPQIQSKSWKTVKCCRAKGKRQTVCGNMNLSLLETRSAFTTHPIHLNDTTGPQPKFPDAVNLQCRKETSDDVLQKFSPTEFLIPSRHGDGDCEPSTNMLVPGEKFLHRDGQQGDKDIESTLTQDVSCENMLEECPGISSQDGSEPLVATTVERNLIDPESSPDSDIYNPVVDSASPLEAGMFTVQNIGINKNRNVPEMSVLHGTSIEVLNSSEVNVSLESASSFATQLQTGKKKGKKEKGRQTCREACTMSDHNLIDKKFCNLDQITSTETLKYVRQRRNGLKERNLVSSDSIKKASRKVSRKGISAMSTIPGMTNLDCSEPRKAELGLEKWAISEHDFGNLQPENDRLMMSDKTKETISKSSKTRVDREKSRLTDPSRRHRTKSCGQKNPRIQKSEKSKNKKKNQTLNGSHETCRMSPGHCGNEIVKPKDDGTCELDCQSLQQRQAWVLCDDCHKWRCIPTALADMIEETNCRWTCKDNVDKAFADCSIPQEKTNSEINAELEISDASCDDVPKQISARHVKSKSPASPAPWTHIKSNLYLHRNRKSQTIDETMVCHCRPSADGSLGCGDQCLNRMLNIECVKGTCPCGELCSNQQFQKRKYARLKWIPCGKKGFGLQSLESVSSGQFLIEYVGEVLDFATYEARQRYYASRNQKHFYFMTLNGGEVIDACAKGNLGRFINHSCEPNCRTEKWMVNGEVCIGLFAIRDIKKGEELTFDYNYVRVFGAAAKKCVCGSSVCRGYIGGDPLNTEVIVQDDSDDEYIEPLMVHEDSEKTLQKEVTFSEGNDMVVKDADASVEKKELLKDYSLILETADHRQTKDTLHRSTTNDTPFSNMGNLQVEDSVSRSISEIQLLEERSKRLDNQQPNEITCCPPSAYQQQIDIPLLPSSAGTNPISDSAANDTSASDTIDEHPTRSKSSLAKSSHSSHTIKKSKQSTKSIVHQKAKKLPVASGNTQFERVERELNELLDADGGISKRKDATRGYLKLLFVTAAEGDNIGAPSQSIRDLSLILDALLKTKSRTVLVDIINKNGLQMLHNILKQNRSKFTRIPILRKLLKVLEFLALKEILAPEHINKGPPCSGMESFKESMLSLTRHSDIQVHQIARNFRDKWIPRTIKRIEPSDREKNQQDTHRSYSGWFQSSSFGRRMDQGARDSDAIVCGSEPVMQQASTSFSKPGETSAHSSHMVSSSLPVTNNNQTNGMKTRKRKSRWDQPSDYKIPDQPNLWSGQQELASEAGSNMLKNGSSDVELCSSAQVPKKLKEDCTTERVAGSEGFLQQNKDDEVPPGFGVLRKDHIVTSDTWIPRGEVGVGYPQERYLSHLSVSYGIPISLVEKLGTPSSVVSAELHEFWTVAPSMPFHPFPPLPPYPRGESRSSSVNTESSKSSIIAQGSSETKPCKPSDLSSQAADVLVPSASVERRSDTPEAWPRNPQSTQRMGWSANCGGANCGGRRAFRPERGNNQRFKRRWVPWSQEGSSDGGHRGSVRYRDTGRSSGGERRHWPPWTQQESDIGSKDCIDGDSSTDVGHEWDHGGGGVSIHRCK